MRTYVIKRLLIMIPTFLGISLIFYLAYTVFATPWVALGFELTPDYHERTRLMGVQNFFSQLAYVVSPWFLLFMQYEPFFDNMVDGAAGLAILIGIFTIAVGILPAIFLKEPYRADAMAHLYEAERADRRTRRGEESPLLASMKDFFKGFAATLRFRPFLKLCAAFAAAPA